MRKKAEHEGEEGEEGPTGGGASGGMKKAIRFWPLSFRDPALEEEFLLG